MQPILEQEYPSTIIPTLAYDPSDSRLTSAHSQLWDLVKTIIDTATRCQTKNEDERGWYKVVRTVLEGSFGKPIASASRSHTYEVRELYVSHSLTQLSEERSA